LWWWQAFWWKCWGNWGDKAQNTQKHLRSNQFFTFICSEHIFVIFLPLLYILYPQKMELRTQNINFFTDLTIFTQYFSRPIYFCAFNFHFFCGWQFLWMEWKNNGWNFNKESVRNCLFVRRRNTEVVSECWIRRLAKPLEVDA